MSSGIKHPHNCLWGAIQSCVVSTLCNRTIRSCFPFIHSRICRDHSVCVDVTFNSLRPRRNRRHFADDIFKCIFLNENVWISIEVPLKFVSKGPINNIPALVQIMAWRRPGDKPLSEPMMIILLTHICVTGPQWVKIVSQWPSPYPEWSLDTNTGTSLLT